MENIENKRRKKYNDIECVPVGFANGVAGDFPLSAEQKEAMIEEAAEHFGRFLTALKCDWQNDPNSMETPRRVAKAYVNDLWKGRYSPFTEITSFPSDGYDGIITIDKNHTSEIVDFTTFDETKALYQTGKGNDPRGSITFMNDGRAVISLFMDEDLSTALHEFGHLYWKAMTDIAALPNASEAIVNDVKTMRAWVDASVDDLTSH